MSDATVTALIVAVPTTIAALGALAVSIIGAIRSKDNGKIIAAVAADTAKVVEHTNGTLSAANTAVKAAENAKDILLERVEGLEKILLELQTSKAEAALLAAQAATDVREAQGVMPSGRDELHPSSDIEGKKIIAVVEAVPVQKESA